MPICGKHIFQSIVIAIGSFTFGNILAFPGPSKKLIEADHPQVVDNPILFDLYNSGSSLFALFGPWFTQFLLQLFRGSRKKTLFVVSTYTTICWFLVCLTKVHIWAGIVCRALLGIALGANSSLCPMYMVELAPPDARGFFGSMSNTFVVFGFVWVNILSPSLKSYMKLIYISGSFTALQAICVYFIHESPAYEREKERRENEAHGQKKESVFQKKYAKGLIIGVAMMFVQQFCGVNAILTNLNELMTSANLNIHPDYQSAIAQLAQFVAVLVGSFVMDLLGRRTVWICSTSILIIFLIIYICYDKYKWKINAIPLVSIFFYEFGFGVGVGPIPWFIVPEYIPDVVRPIAQACVSSISWVFSFIIIVSFPSMKKKMNLYGALIFYLCITAFGLFFGIFFINKKDEGGQESDKESSYKDEASSSSSSNRSNKSSSSNEGGESDL